MRAPTDETRRVFRPAPGAAAPALCGASAAVVVAAGAAAATNVPPIRIRYVPSESFGLRACTRRMSVSGRRR
jgi:hypothetical protein